MTRSRFIVLLLALLAIAACEHEPFPAPPPGSGIDTTGNHQDTIDPGGKPCHPDTVYFNRDILPVLSANCAFSGCHDAASAQDGVILTSYSLTVATADISPFDPDGGKLYELISGQDFDPGDPYSIMPPQGYTPLTNEEVAMIRKWILQGAQNLECDDCDTSNISFQIDVLPIFQVSCEGCHNQITANGGISLTNHAEISQEVLFGEVIQRINHEPGYTPMPPSGIKLAQCKLDKIEAWVNAGLPNN